VNFCAINKGIGFMNHDYSLGDPAELAAVYAAGAMRHDELIEFEAHLAAGCVACRAELGQLACVVAALASAVPSVTPDPGTRQKVLRRVAAKAEPTTAASPLRGQLLGEGAHEAHPTPVVTKKASEASWVSTAIPGISMRVLFVGPENNQFTALVRMAPGTSYPRHIHSGPEECFVLEGDLHVGDIVLRPGDYQRAPAGSEHGVQSTDQGCLLFITSSLTDEFV
jgi:anti-sigma factor ChrR (cupin superfamily)